VAKIRVVLADDHTVLRAGLRMLLNAQPDMEVVGEAADAREALAHALAAAPDVLTLDLTMPGGGSLKLVEQLRERLPQTHVLVLTMHDDPAYCRAALGAGAAGYVVKTAADAQLLTAIRAVARGRLFVDPGLPGAGGGPAAAPAEAHPLSAREREVLTLLAQGHTNQVIADRLFLSVKTVETYRARIAEKLGLRTRADLIRYAVETGLLAPARPAGEADPS
jgi:DNA-binding NarL/FixJ family response regulator